LVPYFHIWCFDYVLSQLTSSFLRFQSIPVHSAPIVAPPRPGLPQTESFTSCGRVGIRKSLFITLVLWQHTPLFCSFTREGGLAGTKLHTRCSVAQQVFCARRALIPLFKRAPSAQSEYTQQHCALALIVTGGSYCGELID